MTRVAYNFLRFRDLVQSVMRISQNNRGVNSLFCAVPLWLWDKLLNHKTPWRKEKKKKKKKKKKEQENRRKHLEENKRKTQLRNSFSSTRFAFRNNFVTSSVFSFFLNRLQGRLELN